MATVETVHHEHESLSLGDRIIHNFRLSYHFSQGSTQLQYRLMTAVARMYDASAFRQEFPTHDSLDGLLEQVKRIKLPKHHVRVTGSEDGDRAITPGEVLLEFGRRWPIQRKILAITQIEYPQEGNYCENGDENKEIVTALKSKDVDLMSDIIRFTIERDVKFIEYLDGGIHGRPGRQGTNQDPFESFLRTYILGGTKTTSSEFDQLFRGLNTFLIGKGMQKTLADLVTIWEEKHPGQRFYPSLDEDF